MWLPITGLVSPSILFYAPDVNTTLVIPSCAEAVITAATYDAYTGRLSVSSGRGYTRNDLIKPDFASPGITVASPSPGGSYGSTSGSCASSALTAGATALLVEINMRRELARYMTVREIKSLFIRGTSRSSFYTYPNREWGYGTMNVYGIFESFLQS